jgi:acyl carrier protein
MTWTEQDSLKLIRMCFKDALAKDFSDVEIVNLKFKATREWDSIAHIKLMATIREKFEIKFSYEDMVRMTTFSEVVQVVKAKTSVKDIQ